MMRLVFWLGSALFAYAYLVFPVLVILRGKLRPRPHRENDVLPFVSVVIAARNEAAEIGGKIDSLTALDYPHDRLEVIVASDGSDDATVSIVEARGHPGVTVLDLPRVGKGSALRAGVEASRGEVLVFSDANSVFAPDALRQLVRPFADPEVGGVAGNQVYRQGGPGDSIAGAEHSYWDLDRALKVAQSRAGNVIAATGAIYAIRRELFRPIPTGVTDDFYLSLAVIAQGRRLVFAPGAIAWEHTAPSFEREYGRKVRIMTRGLRCVAVMRQTLDPRRFGFYSIQLFSHKVLMRTMGIPLLAVAASSLALARHGGLYGLAAAAQAAFYGLAAAGLLLARRPAGRRRILSLPAYFCLVQAASVHAAWNLLTGRTYDRWDPARAAGAGATAASPSDGGAPDADGPLADGSGRPG